MRIPRRIPDAWLGGFLRAHPDATVADAVAAWQEQDRLQVEYERARCTFRWNGSRCRDEAGHIGLHPC